MNYCLGVIDLKLKKWIRLGWILKCTDNDDWPKECTIYQKKKFEEG